MWNRPIHVLTRAELYDLVWSEAVAKVAERYKLSGNGLAKICRKHAVPLPPRGYWAKVQHGKKPRRSALRAAKTPDAETVRFAEGPGRRAVAARKPELAPAIDAAVTKALMPENRIVVTEAGSRHHRLVLELARTTDHSWDGQRKTPEPVEQRRRRVLTAFFRAVERARGTVGAITFNGSFEVTLFGSVFRLSCSEPERRVRVPLAPKEIRERQSWETRDWKTESRRSGVLRMRVLGERDRHKDFEDSDDALFGRAPYRRARVLAPE